MKKKIILIGLLLISSTGFARENNREQQMIKGQIVEVSGYMEEFRKDPELLTLLTLKRSSLNRQLGELSGSMSEKHSSQILTSRIEKAVADPHRDNELLTLQYLQRSLEEYHASKAN